MAKPVQSPSESQTIKTVFLPKVPPFPCDMRILIQVNETNGRLDIQVESREPLDSVHLEMIQEMFDQPRGSPPPTEEEFKLFCQDVDHRGLGNAVRGLLDTYEKRSEGRDDKLPGIKEGQDEEEWQNDDEEQGNKARDNVEEQGNRVQDDEGHWVEEESLPKIGDMTITDGQLCWKSSSFNTDRR